MRFDFPGYSGGDKLEPISWDEFFDKFEASHLALVYQEKTKDGELSRFNKLVSRSKHLRFSGSYVYNRLPSLLEFGTS